MDFLRFFPLPSASVAALGALFLVLGMTGCATRYYKVVTTDARGELVASWVSKGSVARREGGYRFTAIERQIPQPRRLYRYPLGYRTLVRAPKTIIYRTEEPAWHKEMTALRVADAAEDGEPITPTFTLSRPGREQGVVTVARE